MTCRAPEFLFIAAAFAFTLGGGEIVSASVTEPPPDLTPLPQPVPAAEEAVVVSRGLPASSVSLAHLFEIQGEALDPMADATAPAAAV